MKAVAFSLCFLGGLAHATHHPPRCPLQTLTTMCVPSQTTCSPQPPQPTKIVCIGDIHGQWNDDDERALRALSPDLALFVGDYGNEDVNITRRISQFAASTTFGVATVFGNHDAFFTQSPNGRKRAPYDRKKECRVTEQMELLKSFDVSYRSVDFDEMRISICGGRAFSIGGPNWKYKDFYNEFVGIRDIQHSTNKLKEAVESSNYSTIVFLSHSGPVGLGSKPSDPCGKDWGEQPGGDYGDEDLRAAIEKARQAGYRVPLAVFGHMHKTLMGKKGERTMVKTEPDGLSGGETVMVNAAVVPRHKIGPHSNSNLHHFQIVHIGGSGAVESVTETWVTAKGEVKENYTIFEANNDQLAIKLEETTTRG